MNYDKTIGDDTSNEIANERKSNGAEEKVSDGCSRCLNFQRGMVSRRLNGGGSREDKVNSIARSVSRGVVRFDCIPTEYQEEVACELDQIAETVTRKRDEAIESLGEKAPDSAHSAQINVNVNISQEGKLPDVVQDAQGSDRKNDDDQHFESIIDELESGENDDSMGTDGEDGLNEGGDEEEE